MGESIENVNRLAVMNESWESVTLERSPYLARIFRQPVEWIERNERIDYGMFGAKNEEGLDGSRAQDLFPLLAVSRLHFELIVEELQRSTRNVHPPVAQSTIQFHFWFFFFWDSPHEMLREAF